ncbi:unnamed protein product [Rotaria socialis]|uniref:Uncharacterized protein n=1 Tax=Rotaria socialis TaxID=392032 RepID=A0A817ZDP3_9BILA|nr:unnamed protein product [Rotaria socialis]CAF4655907.1 unnamed protein product [Rotaria socialis]
MANQYALAQGNCCGFGPYPNPIAIVYTDDRECTIIVGFGPDSALDIRDIVTVELEVKRLLPDCRVKQVFLT